MNKTPSSKTMQVWSKLIRVEQSLLKTIEMELKHNDLPPLSWYDVLLELSKIETVQLSPKELEDRLLLSQYNISRLLDRMEKNGLIQRETCKNDRRAKMIILTKKGSEIQKKIWNFYAPFLQRVIGDKLSDKETQALINLLEKIQ